MDPASSEFFREGVYDLGIKDKTSAKLTPDGLADLYRDLIAKYPLVLIEDPFAEDDFASWTNFMEKNKGGPEIVGDDLTVTNVERVKLAKEKEACDGLLLKINQIGTITEAIAAYISPLLKAEPYLLILEQSKLSIQLRLGRLCLAPLWRNNRRFHRRSYSWSPNGSSQDRGTCSW